MKNIFIPLSLLVLFIIGKDVYAQPCASLNISLVTGTLNQPCDTTQVVNFTVNADVNTNFPVLETDTYSVSQGVYNPLPWVSANSFNVPTDDIWSQVYNIPFKFCFFGVSYDQFIIGSNGQVGFNLSNAGQFNPWGSAGYGPAPTNQPASMNNCIFPAYHDILFGGSFTVVTWGYHWHCSL
jgi:hypothetical protein